MIHIRPVLAAALIASTAVTTVMAQPAQAASPADCVPGHVTTFVPPAGTDDPFGITAGPGGTWFAHGATIDRIRRGGGIDEFPVPDSGSADVGWLTWSGSSPWVWFADRGTGRLGVINAAGTVRTHQIPDGANGPAVPQGIVLEPGHGAWFTDQANDRIGHYDIATRSFSFVLIPTTGGGPLGLVRGADADLYFTERAADRVGRLDPATGLFTEWTLSSGAFPNRLAVAPDGSVWFTELLTDQLGVITPDGHLREIPVSGGPVGITYADGHLYVAMFFAGQAAEFDLAGSLTRTFTLPRARGALQLTTIGTNAWVADGFGNHVYRIRLAC